MLLLELATQGVKGFSPSVRVQFRPGYNVLVPPPGASPGLLPLLVALLYGDGRGGDASLAAGHAPARAGLSLQGRDGKTYRLMRALGSGGALHRLEANNSWAVVSQDAAEISQALRSMLGLPSRGQFEELFCFDSNRLPSRRPAAEPPPGAGRLAGAPSSSGEPRALRPGALAEAAASSEPRGLRPNALVEAALAAAASARPRPLDPEGTRRDLARLRQEVQAGKQIDEDQYRLEGLQRRLFDADLKLKEVERLRQEVEAGRAALEGGHSLDTLNLPKDAAERAARYDEARRKHEEGLEKIREEQRAADEVAERRLTPFWQQPQFPLGVGVGALFLGLSVAFRGSPLGYLGLLDIPAFGYAGLVALRWIGDLQAREDMTRRRGIYRDREQKLEASFENEYLPIRAAMKMLGVERGADLVEHLQGRQASESGLEEVSARLGALEKDPATVAAHAARAEVKGEVERLEARLGELGATSTRDWREAEREIAEIEGALGSPTPPPAAAPTPAPAPRRAPERELVALGGTFGGEPGAAREDPLPRLFSISQDLFSGMALEALATSVRERAGQYFSALTERRFAGVEIDARGRGRAIAAGKSVPAGTLEEGDLDLLYLSVKLTLVERAAPTSKVCVLLDEPFAAFEEPRQQLLSRMLKYIAAQTQVIHASALASHRALADAAVQG